MYARINNVKIFFDVEGMGYVPDGPIMRRKPVCFLLHGGPGGDHGMYKPAMTPLTEYVQLVYIDNRGSGMSDRSGPQSTYTIYNNVEDIEALRQYLGLDKIMILGGSYGGMVAATYATTYPENLEGLVLVTTMPCHGKYNDMAKEYVRRNGTPEQIAMAQVLWDGAFTSREHQDEYYEVLAPLYNYNYEPPKTEEQKLAMRHANLRSKRSHEPLNEGFGNVLRTWDVTDKLELITCPTLIIGARHDWICPIEASYEMHERIRGSELVICEKSGHFLFKDEFPLFMSSVTNFLRNKVIPFTAEQ